jgi:hypothetical protein
MQLQNSTPLWAMMMADDCAAKEKGLLMKAEGWSQWGLSASLGSVAPEVGRWKSSR